MTIPTNQTRARFTQVMADVYREQLPAPGFFRSFFREPPFSVRKYVSIEVQRGSEKIAVDVKKAGADGNLNQSTKSTQKVIDPPMFWEYTAMNQHDMYDVAIGSQDPAVIATVAQELALENIEARRKIERAYEQQCRQVLDTGVLEFSKAESIDFKRKAASLVNVSTGAGNEFWGHADATPEQDLIDGCEFLRKEGKSAGGVVNAVHGSQALSALLDTDFVKNFGDLRRVDRMSIQAPQRLDAQQGGILHGQISAGSWIINIWTYPEFYEDSAGDMQPWMPENKVFLLPEQPRFVLQYAAVPQLMGEGGSIRQQGAFYQFEWMSERSGAHEFHTKSAGVAVPVAVDQIYTMQVLAD